MEKINAKRREYLEEKFGNRVSFNDTERKLYGHDIASMPSLFKPIIGDTTPDSTYNILLPGADWNAMTFGTGFHVYKFDFDWAFEYLMGKERHISTQGPHNIMGDHNVNLLFVEFSGTYYP